MLFLFQMIRHGGLGRNKMSFGLKATLIWGRGPVMMSKKCNFQTLSYILGVFRGRVAYIAIFFIKKVRLCPTGYKYIDIGGREQNLRGSISKIPLWPTPKVTSFFTKIDRFFILWNRKKILGLQNFKHRLMDTHRTFFWKKSHVRHIKKKVRRVKYQKKRNFRPKRQFFLIFILKK